MSFVTIPATYSNGVIKTREKIKRIPSRIIVTLEYDDGNVVNNDLLDVLENSKNSSKTFNSIDDLFYDLEN